MTGAGAGPYAALDWRFEVRCDVAVIAQELDRVLEPLRVELPAERTYQIRRVPDDGGLELSCDAEVLCCSADEALVFRRLLGHLNVGALLASPQYVLLHAAAAEHHGRAVILSAPMESGKTTLVAGLVRSGLDYLTDEAVAVRPSDGRLVGYPKALSIDRGSWDVLRDLRPPQVGERQHLGAVQWQVPVTAIRADAICASAEPAVVILPRYVHGAPTVLTEISRGNALLEVLQQCFHLDRNRNRDMRVLAKMLGRCDTYRLQVGELDAAVDLVRSALGP
jgi:hypothetical protein